jgi:BMFP domain-containing protein YqiC
MVNKTKILSDLSKIAVDAMSTFSGIKKEIETIVKLKVDNAINKMNLVKRDEFEVLKKIVQKISLEKSNLKKKKKSVKQNKNKKLNKKKKISKK